MSDFEWRPSGYTVMWASISSPAVITCTHIIEGDPLIRAFEFTLRETAETRQEWATIKAALRDNPERVGRALWVLHWKRDATIKDVLEAMEMPMPDPDPALVEAVEAIGGRLYWPCCFVGSGEKKWSGGILSLGQGRVAVRSNVLSPFLVDIFGIMKSTEFARLVNVASNIRGWLIQVEATDEAVIVSVKDPETESQYAFAFRSIEEVVDFIKWPVVFRGPPLLRLSLE